MSAPHARTDADALLPAEREMTAAQWAEYGGLPTVLRGYCHLLMKREADARLRERQAELEVAEWRERTARLLTRAKAAEAALAAARAEVARLRTAIGDAAVELPVWPEGAYQTPTERDVSAVRAGLYATLGVTR